LVLNLALNLALKTKFKTKAKFKASRLGLGPDGSASLGPDFWDRPQARPRFSGVGEVE